MKLFEGVKYYIIGNLTNEDNYTQILESQGAKRSNYLSDFVTLAIAEINNTNPERDEINAEIEEANDIYEMPIVDPLWIICSHKLNRQLPYPPFYPKACKPFLNFQFLIDKNLILESCDKEVLWIFIALGGGVLLKTCDITESCVRFQSSLYVTHIISDNPDINLTMLETLGEINFPQPISENFHVLLNEIDNDNNAVAQPSITPLNLHKGNTNCVKFVTPDWISDTFNCCVMNCYDKNTLSIDIYHPKHLKPFASPPFISVSNVPLEKNFCKLKNCPDLLPQNLPGDVNMNDKIKNETFKLNSSFEINTNNYLTNFEPCDTKENLTKTPFDGTNFLVVSEALNKENLLIKDQLELNNDIFYDFSTTGFTYYGHAITANVPVNRCLSGTKFHIDSGYVNIIPSDNMKSWKKAINHFGGVVVEDQTQPYNHLLIATQTKSYFEALNKFPKIKCVTAHWLNDCIYHKEYRPPWKFLHLPLPLPRDLLLSQIPRYKPSILAMHTISISNFEDEERTQLKHMLWEAGAKYTGSLSSANTLLIAKKAEGRKWQKAKQLNIPIVNIHWLIDAFIPFDGDKSDLTTDENRLPPFNNMRYQTFCNGDKIQEKMENESKRSEFKTTIFLPYARFTEVMKPWTQPFETVKTITSTTCPTMDASILQSKSSCQSTQITDLPQESLHNAPSNINYKVMEIDHLPLVGDRSKINLTNFLLTSNGSNKENTASPKKSPKAVSPRNKNYNLTKDAANAIIDNGEALRNIFQKNINSEISKYSFNPILKKRLLEAACQVSKKMAVYTYDINLNSCNNNNNGAAITHKNGGSNGNANLGTSSLSNTFKSPTNNGSPSFKILLTSFGKTFTHDLIKKIQDLGGDITENPLTCTHLVMDSVKRTIKFFCALSHTKHIVTSEWIIDSHKEGKFLDENYYILKDVEAESVFNFCLKTSLYRAQHRGSLFLNIAFYVTPHVEPSIKILKPIIESAGGSILNQRPSTRKINIQNKDRNTLIVISCPTDFSICKDYIIQNISIYNVELIMTSLIQQNINFDEFALKLPNE